MTIKKRKKHCAKCGVEIHEKVRHSEAEWNAKLFCSVVCRNKSRLYVVSIFERIKRFQIVENGCWKWNGAKDPNGYGIISNRNGSHLSPEKAHRVSYEAAFGEIPKGMNVCHRCDNPECTNPAHLFLGSQKDNMKDCAKKGRVNKVSYNNLVPGKQKHRGAGVPKNRC